MASLRKIPTRFFKLVRIFRDSSRSIAFNNNKTLFNPMYKMFGVVVGAGTVYYLVTNPRNSHTVKAVELDEDVSLRENMFTKMASVEYDGQLYMTPQDFLEAVVESKPRPRVKRKMLRNDDLDNIRNTTPATKEAGPRMFRDLGNNGIISYTEYLFLLSILIKPKSGFEIAFKMFDTDGNKAVDKKEFLVIRKIFSQAWRSRRGLAKEEKLAEPSEEFIDDDQGLQRRNLVDTTLVLHFFGKNGDSDLHYSSFRKFMKNLQTEVLEIEFNEFSKGSTTISKIDFAKILLRYTDVNADKFLNRLHDRVKEDDGITFKEFRIFFQFLNNLEDFTAAMRLYTLADHAISEDEFLRAVKICTGSALSKHVVHTVFALFDDDGDGNLSHREFVAIMKDRQSRGFKITQSQKLMEPFKQCFREEIKSHKPTFSSAK